MHRITLLEFARKLRREQTSAEARLWGALRKRGLSGFCFIRQAKIGPYCVDFLCRERGLAVEVDGATHSSEMELRHDLLRTYFIESIGYSVYRVNNEDVYCNLTGVLDSLLLALEARPSAFKRSGPLSPSNSSPNKLGERS